MAAGRGVVRGARREAGLALQLEERPDLGQSGGDLRIRHGVVMVAGQEELYAEHNKRWRPVSRRQADVVPRKDVDAAGP